MEDHPAHCHRHTLICVDHFPQAQHIWEGGLYLARDLAASIQADAPDTEAVGELASWT